MPRTHVPADKATPTPTPNPTPKGASPAPSARTAKSAPVAKAGPSPAPAAPSKPPARPRRRGRLDMPVERTSRSAAPAAARSAKAAKQPARAPAPKSAKAKARAGLSALDAAAQVLDGLRGNQAREGIGASDLIERMRRDRLWSSPGGKTPAATLYAAMIREITRKKGESRFARVSPGRFAPSARGKARRGGGAR